MAGAGVCAVAMSLNRGRQLDPLSLIVLLLDLEIIDMKLPYLV